LGALAIGPEFTFTKIVVLRSCFIDMGLLLGEIDRQAILSVEKVFLADSGEDLGLETGRLQEIALAMTFPEIFTEGISISIIRTIR